MTKQYLEDYLLLEKSIQRCEKKLKYYLEHPIQTVAGTVMSSMQEFPYCLTHITVSASDSPKAELQRNELIKTLTIEIAYNMQKYEEKRLYIDLFIESIENLEIKEILSQKYLEGRTLEQIGEDLCYDKSTISKKIDNYFQQIQQADVVY